MYIYIFHIDADIYDTYVCWMMLNGYHGDIMIYFDILIYVLYEIWRDHILNTNIGTYYDEMWGVINYITILYGEPTHIGCQDDDFFRSTVTIFEIQPLIFEEQRSESENPQLHLQNQAKPIELQDLT